MEKSNLLELNCYLKLSFNIKFSNNCVNIMENLKEIYRNQFIFMGIDKFNTLHLLYEIGKQVSHFKLTYEIETNIIDIPQLSNH